MPRAGPDRRDRSGRFKITAKAFFLTYPQVPDLEKEDFYGYFLDDFAHGASNTKPQDVLVAKEAHQDGTPHFHIFLRFPARLDIINQREFDFGPYHPNIQSARSPKKVIAYCTKERNFLANFHVEIKLSPQEVLEDSEDVDDFLRKCMSMPSAGWNNARSFNSLKAMAERHFGKKNAAAKVINPVFDITTFINVPDAVTEFLHSIRQRQPGGRDRVKSLWLWGRSRLGKTALASSLGKHSRIANVWNFKSLDQSGTAEYLLLDDLSWESIQYQFKSLLGCQCDVSFTGKYQHPTSFRFGIPAVVLTNTLPVFTADELDWLDENVEFVNITETLYVA